MSNKGTRIRRLNLRHAFSTDRRDSAVFLIIALIILLISTAGTFNPAGVLNLILYPTPDARHDRWTTNDLSNIFQAASQYPEQSSELALTDLGVKHLHYSLNDYTFEWSPGAGGTPATYTVCAIFDRSTISKATDLSQIYQNGDFSVYSVHHKGRQCYDTNLGPYTSGTRLAS